MVTSIDLFAIKERIRDVLQDNISLFSGLPTDKTKLRKIVAGAPKLVNGKIPGPYPALYVTSDDIEHNTLEPWDVTSNIGNTFEHELNFLIIFVADGKDGFAGDYRRIYDYTTNEIIMRFRRCCID